MTEPHLRISKSRSFHDGLSHFLRAIGSREGHDVALLFGGESTRMLATLLEYVGKGITLVTRKTAPVPGSKLIATLTYVRSFVASSSWAAARLRMLSDLFEEWAMLNRLWGLFDVWMFARALWTQASTKQDAKKPMNAVNVAIEASKLLSLAFFHICEAGALLAGKGLLSVSSKTRERLRVLSVRGWATFTFLELGRLLLEKSQVSRSPALRSSPDWFKHWKKEFFANLAWAPVTVHVGTANGILPEPLIDLLGVYATASLVRDRWVETAQHNENDETSGS